MIEVSVALALAASIFLGVSIVIAGHRKPAYSHVRQTISELAEYGTEHTQQVSLGVFLPVSVFLGVIAWLLRFADPPVAALALSIAVGYGVSAIFPCDPGSPLFGSARQAIHNLGGGIEYLGGALSLWWIAETTSPVFRVAGMLVGISAILLSFASSVRGVIQRIAETCLFLGLVVALLMR